MSERASLKALTVRQPWAALLLAGIKDVENRPWRTHYRGPLAIHAGARVDRVGIELFPDVHGPRGVVLGTVELIDVVRDSDSPWAVGGAWHWVLSDPRPWPTPYPTVGRLGLWTLF